MKKVFFIALALALIITGALVFEFVRSLGISDAAKLVPGNAFVFISAPDLLRTITRWPRTSLAKISREPEVKDFLEKPIAFLKSNQGDDVGESLQKVKPRQVFVTLTNFSPAEAHILLGFQFFGKRQHVEDSFKLIGKKVVKNAVISSQTSDNYHGDAIQSMVSKGKTLYTSIHGRWAFLSNHLPTLQEALDRASGKNRQNSLAENADYLKLNSQLPSQPDLQIFVNSKLALDALLAVGASIGSIPDASQLQQLQKIGAIGVSSKLEVPNMRDSVAILLDQPPSISPLQHTTMNYARSNTLAYLEISKDWYGLLGMSPLLAGKIHDFFIQTQFPLHQPNQIFGAESAFLLSWPAENLRPHTVFLTQIQNQSEAIKLLEQTNFGRLPPNSRFPYSIFYQSKFIQYPRLRPIVAFHDNLLFAGLTASDVEEVLQRPASTETLEHSPAFTSALPRYHAQNLLFAFFDTKRLFEHIYSILRPVIIFGTAALPDLMQVIDSSKLPNTESVSKHLQPIVFTQEIKDHVAIFNSTGPITLNQAFLVFLLGKYALFSTQH